MRIVLDTNVFISGVFFGGPPYQILDAWRHGHIDIVLSEEALAKVSNCHPEPVEGYL